MDRKKYGAEMLSWSVEQGLDVIAVFDYRNETTTSLTSCNELCKTKKIDIEWDGKNRKAA